MIKAFIIGLKAGVAFLGACTAILAVVFVAAGIICAFEGLTRKK